jgi:hypothetical protein
MSLSCTSYMLYIVFTTLILHVYANDDISELLNYLSEDFAVRRLRSLTGELAGVGLSFLTFFE